MGENDIFRKPTKETLDLWEFNPDLSKQFVLGMQNQ
jgi:hypothetical protein